MRRSLGAIAAVIVLAAISFFAYAHYHHHHLVNNSGGDLPVGVLVAKSAIDKGTAGSVIAAQALYSVKTLLSSEVPQGAFRDPRALKHEVAKQDIRRGALLTAARFAPSASP